MSKARVQFDNTMLRAENMLDSAIKLPELLEADPTDIWFQDTVRASIVIAVAAMDSYFTKKFVEVLVEFLKKNGPTDALVELLQKAGLDTRESLKLLGMQRPYRRIRNLVEAHFETYVTQRFSVIDDLYIGFSLKDLSANAIKKTGYIRAQSSIEKLIEKRHQIVHEGDVNSHGKIRGINPNEIKNKFKLLRLFVECSDDIIEKKIKSIKRSI